MSKSNLNVSSNFTNDESYEKFYEIQVLTG